MKKLLLLLLCFSMSPQLQSLLDNNQGSDIENPIIEPQPSGLKGLEEDEYKKGSAKIICFVAIVAIAYACFQSFVPHHNRV